MLYFYLNFFKEEVVSSREQVSHNSRNNQLKWYQHSQGTFIWPIVQGGVWCHSWIGLDLYLRYGGEWEVHLNRILFILILYCIKKNLNIMWIYLYNINIFFRLNSVSFKEKINWADIVICKWIFSFCFYFLQESRVSLFFHWLPQLLAVPSCNRWLTSLTYQIGIIIQKNIFPFRL